MADLGEVSEYRFILPDLAEGQALFDEIRVERQLDYRDSNLPSQDRAAQLLAQMTLAEKVGQMTQINTLRLMGSGDWDKGPLNDRALANIFDENQVGSILAGGGAGPADNTPAAWATLSNDLQDAAANYSQLDIPIIYGIDAVHGHNNVLGATIYPHNIGLGATWNPELVFEINKAVAEDMRVLGHHWNFSPVADMARDARWGRFYEAFSEDPTLVSSMVAASVKGLQASGEVAATLKHFAGYGQALTGFDRSPAHMDMRSFRHIHLPSFEAGIEADALTMMVNSGSVNGVPAHASHYLLTELAREQMGFEGVFISDWEDIMKLVSVHKVATDFKEAIAMSINAGVDMYMVPNDASSYTRQLIELVEEGKVSEARIDEATSRILALKFQLGLFEDSLVDVEQADTLIEEERNLAKQAALESITLLENDAVLPLSKDSKVFLVGPNSHSLANQMGGWTIGWQGLEGNTKPPGLTILEALEQHLGKDNLEDKLSYSRDYRNVDKVAEMASEADVSIVVLGETPYAEGEGNDERLALSHDQHRLLEALSETDTPIVLVLLAGRPLIIPTDFHHRLDAFIMAYLPGSEAGTALTDVLYGHYNPSGKLPFSWPKHTGQIPISHDRLVTSPYAPLYPFGYGLSYTSFRKSNLALSASELSTNASTLSLSLDVENTGDMKGSEVVQVYASFPALGVVMNEQRLIGFLKVVLEPSETKTISLDIPLSRLEVIPGDVLGLAEAKLLAGKYSIFVNGIQRHATLTLTDD